MGGGGGQRSVRTERCGRQRRGEVRSGAFGAERDILQGRVSGDGNCCSELVVGVGDALPNKQQCWGVRAGRRARAWCWRAALGRGGGQVVRARLRRLAGIPTRCHLRTSAGVQGKASRDRTPAKKIKT